MGGWVGWVGRRGGGGGWIGWKREEGGVGGWVGGLERRREEVERCEDFYCALMVSCSQWVTLSMIGLREAEKNVWIACFYLFFCM